MFHVKHPKKPGLEGVWRGSKGGLAPIKHPRRRTLPARAGGWAITACLMLAAACSSPEEVSDKTGAATATANPATPPSPPAPPTPDADKVAFTDNAAKGEAKRDFAYTWPAAVSAVPELTARFTAERDKLLADQKSEWNASLQEFAGQDCAGCVNRDFQKVWEVVADIPGFLSLSQMFYEYSGGAHGNSGSDGLVWDREAQQALAPEDLFTSPKALQDVLGTRWCKVLQAERRRRMGGEAPIDNDVFPCPPIKDLTLLLGSKSKTHFDRIGLIADPYVAGSYAEGQYEITLPVTTEVLTAVKPRYRAAFARGE